MTPTEAILKLEATTAYYEKKMELMATAFVVLWHAANVINATHDDADPRRTPTALAVRDVRVRQLIAEFAQAEPGFIADASRRTAVTSELIREQMRAYR